MKKLEARLNALCSRNGKVKRAALALLKDYIRQYGEIDLNNENEWSWFGTTLYANGYFTADIVRVYIDEQGLLVMVTEKKARHDWVLRQCTKVYQGARFWKQALCYHV